jgi:hypothetical protein
MAVNLRENSRFYRLQGENKMNTRLRSMLVASAVADRERVLLSLELLSEHPAGIGDHSTTDFYANAEEALAKLAEADDRLEMLDKYFSSGV